jgi:hypothetical protein
VIGGALAYFRLPREGTDKPIHGAKASLTAKISEHIGVGISGKGIWGPNLSGELGQMYDGDTGIIALWEPLQLGLMAKNVLGGNPAMGEGREFSLGGRIHYQGILFLNVSATSESQRIEPVQYAVGVEYLSPYLFSLKGGYRFRPYEGKSYWGCGASINSPRLSIHYAVEIPAFEGVSPTHGIGLTVLM